MVALNSVSDAIALLRELRERLGNRVEAFEIMSAPQLAIVLKHMNQLRNPIAGDAPWYAMIEIADSHRDVAKYRITAIHGPWGGTTRLTYGFDDPDENPDLHSVIETIASTEDQHMAGSADGGKAGVYQRFVVAVFVTRTEL